MHYEKEINNLFGIFINDDSYFPMFQRLGSNISETNPSFKEKFENAVLFHPNEINPKPTESEQKKNKDLRIELVNLIRNHLREFDQKTYGEIYKLFQSVDQMRDELDVLKANANKFNLNHSLKKLRTK